MLGGWGGGGGSERLGRRQGGGLRASAPDERGVVKACSFCGANHGLPLRYCTMRLAAPKTAPHRSMPFFLIVALQMLTEVLWVRRLSWCWRQGFVVSGAEYQGQQQETMAFLFPRSKVKKKRNMNTLSPRVGAECSLSRAEGRVTHDTHTRCATLTQDTRTRTTSTTMTTYVQTPARVLA